MAREQESGEQGVHEQGVHEPGVPDSGYHWGSGWFWWLLGTSIVVALAFVLKYEPPDKIILPGLELPLPESCWTKRAFGTNCPGCGLTRSFVLSAGGRFSEAFRMHPVGTIMFLVLVAQIPVRLLQGRYYWQERKGVPVQSSGFSRHSRTGWVELFVVAIATGASIFWWITGLLLG